MSLIKRLVSKISDIWVKSSSERYIAFLRKTGVQIGEGTRISARSSCIDITRPSLVCIGDNCYLNENFTLLTHDYVTKVFLHKKQGLLKTSSF